MQHDVTLQVIIYMSISRVSKMQLSDVVSTYSQRHHKLLQRYKNKLCGKLELSRAKRMSMRVDHQTDSNIVTAMKIRSIAE